MDVLNYVVIVKMFLPITFADINLEDSGLRIHQRHMLVFIFLYSHLIKNDLPLAYIHFILCYNKRSEVAAIY